MSKGSTGLLQNRVILLAVLLASLYGSAVSWLSLNGPGEPRTGEHTPILIVGLACAIFISAAIAVRSEFRGDRAVFGALAGALLLAALGPIAPPATGVLLAINAGRALLWTAAALGSVVLVVRRPARPSGA
jgi:hypothetical protein